MCYTINSRLPLRTTYSINHVFFWFCRPTGTHQSLWATSWTDWCFMIKVVSRTRSKEYPMAVSTTLRLQEKAASTLILPIMQATVEINIKSAMPFKTKPCCYQNKIWWLLHPRALYPLRCKLSGRTRQRCQCPTLYITSVLLMLTARALLY